MDGLDQMEYLANFHPADPEYFEETSTGCSVRSLRPALLQVLVHGMGMDVSTQRCLDSAACAPGNFPWREQYPWQPQAERGPNV